MHGETEIPQKMEVNPESIRIGNMQAQAGIGTRLMLSYFRDVEQMDHRISARQARNAEGRRFGLTSSVLKSLVLCSGFPSGVSVWFHPADGWAKTRNDATKGLSLRLCVP